MAALLTRLRCWWGYHHWDLVCRIEQEDRPVDFLKFKCSDCFKVYFEEEDRDDDMV